MRRFIAVLVVLSVRALAEPVKAPELSADEVKRLDKGEVVTRNLTPKDNKGVAALALGVIDADTATVWPVVRDCQHFKHFMPRTKGSALKQDPTHGPLCRVELSMPFPLTDLWSETKSVMREEPAGHYLRSWSLVTGTYHRNDGSWTLVPWGQDKSKTLLVYAIDSDPKLLVPDALIRAGQTGSLPDVVKQVRKRVAQVQAEAAAKPKAAAPEAVTAAAPAPGAEGAAGSETTAAGTP
jgi:hypothetical protein